MVVLIFSLTTSYMIKGMGIVGTFGLFATISILGVFYYLYAMVSTQGLSASECKQAFWPKDLKQVEEEELLIEQPTMQERLSLNKSETRSE